MKRLGYFLDSDEHSLTVGPKSIEILPFRCLQDSYMLFVVYQYL
jgi:hypothetical protein